MKHIHFTSSNSNAVSDHNARRVAMFFMGDPLKDTLCTSSSIVVAWARVFVKKTKEELHVHVLGKIYPVTPEGRWANGCPEQLSEMENALLEILS